MLTLVLNPRSKDNLIYIGNDIVVKIIKVDAEEEDVHIGVDAPPELTIDRASIRTKRLGKIRSVLGKHHHG